MLYSKSCFTVLIMGRIRWDKVFKNGASKICGKEPLKNLKGYGLLNIFWKIEKCRRYPASYYGVVLTGSYMMATLAFNDLKFSCDLSQELIIKNGSVSKAAKRS